MPDAAAATHRASLRLALLALAGLVAQCTPPEPHEGSWCVFNNDCKEPLICAGTHCRVVCRTDRDCPLERACLPGAQPGSLLCLPPGDRRLCVDSSQCQATEFCAIDGYCRPQCVQDYDCRLLAPDAVCGPAGVCVRGDAAPGDAALDAMDGAPIDAPRDALPPRDSGLDAPVDAPVGMDAATLSDRAFLADTPALTIPPDAYPTARIVQAVEDSDHGCAVLEGGAVYCWGRNVAGQLGRGMVSTVSTYLSPARATVFDLPVAQVAVGSSVTCVREVAGTMRCVGDNSSGQLGDGTMTSPRTSAVAPTGITSVVDVSTSGGTTCAVLADHSASCWGYNGALELGDPGASVRNPTPVVVPGVANAARVYAATNAGYAVLSDGTVLCWGTNQGGAYCGRPVDGVSTPVAVPGVTGAFALAHHNDFEGVTCALVTGGAVTCWGRNNRGLIGQAPSAAILPPTAIAGLTGAVDVGINSNNVCVAASSEPSIRCWGLNGPDGELGAGLIDGGLYALSPVGVAGIWNARHVSLGTGGLALLADGTVRCWGGVAYQTCGRGGQIEPWRLGVP